MSGQFIKYGGYEPGKRKAVVIVMSLTILVVTVCIFGHILAEAPNPISPGIWSSAAELAQVPMSGPGWEAVKKWPNPSTPRRRSSPIRTATTTWPSSRPASSTPGPACKATRTRSRRPARSLREAASQSIGLGVGPGNRRLCDGGGFGRLSHVRF